MKPYETEQRKLLVALFRADPDRVYTADEVAQILRGDSDDEHCSISTVYRLISRLCDEGVLHRHARDGSRKFYYQYVKSCECEAHLHLQCEQCGKIIHMDDLTSEQVLLEVLRKNGFSIDRAKALVPGICESCRGCDASVKSGVRG